ncbi:MAG: DUF3858 domain-containing protein, partial [candidate division Zixibacteria bacterium]|nr:DUF3858 domain-containing protein [candidate division Zixibacteria bacterium]
LAAALLSKAKIKTLPVFTCSDFGNINTNVPGLTQLSNIGLWLSGDNLAAYYEPTKSEIKSGPLSFFSRMAWLAGNDEQPTIRINGTEKSSLNNVRIDLFYDEGKKRFVGTGFCSATNYFNQYQKMTGMKNEAFEYFEELVSSVFKNAKLISYNPLGEFKILNSVFSFHFEIESLAYDDDKILLNLGESNCGIFANLPENTELFHNQRTSPIHLPCQMSQNIKLNLDLNGLDLISYPEDKLIKNEAGNFGITSKITGKKLTITRSLTLAKTYYTGEEWLQFRTLLLADRNENNRLILIDED